MTAQQTARILELVRPGDDTYEAATHTFFATGQPALVARPREPDDVAAALIHARRQGLAVSVRSGGHSPLGHSTNDGGLVIDLAHLDQVDVLDAERRVVRVGGGATWGQVAAALEPYGWAITAGDTANVGVGGLTLGGGIGWLVRRYGLTIDNLVGAQVVTADGQLVTTSPHEHRELFWALRGGGGNFGVVTSFDFVAQPVSTVHFGTVSYRLDDPTELLHRWRDAMRAAPDDLSSTLAFSPRVPGVPPSATVLLCYASEPGTTTIQVDAAVEPLFELGTVTAATIAEQPYGEILEQAAAPPGLRLVTRNTLVPTIDDALVADISRVHTGPVPTAVALRSLGGAVRRVPSDATAFAHRDAEAMVVGLLLFPEAATEPEIARGLAPWRDVAAHGTGTYINFQGSATPSDLAAAYPPATYARLAAVKRAYDPGNRFALNHNIEPALCEQSIAMTTITTKTSVNAALLAGVAMTVVATVAAYLERSALIDHIRTGYPSYSQARIDTAANTYLVVFTVVGVVGVAGWLWTIRSVYLDRRWARAVATALFTLGLAVAVTALFTKDTSGELGLPPSLAWVPCLPCLPGLLAVVLLWRRR